MLRFEELHSLFRQKHDQTPKKLELPYYLWPPHILKHT